MNKSALIPSLPVGNVIESEVSTSRFFEAEASGYSTFLTEKFRRRKSKIISDNISEYQ